MLSTHSCYFVEAIKAYGKKHGIEDKCQYYLADNHTGGSIIRCVTDCLEDLDVLSAKPIQMLLEDQDETSFVSECFIDEVLMCPEILKPDEKPWH